jgi:hypothetical protein
MTTHLHVVSKIKCMELLLHSPINIPCMHFVIAETSPLHLPHINKLKKFQHEVGNEEFLKPIMWDKILHYIIED